MLISPVNKANSRARTRSTDNPGGFGHTPALDGVRGLALLLILIDHLLWSNGSTGSRVADFLARIRSSTYCGVDLFFALSGFLITGILLDSLGVQRYFTTFYARRALRIFPLYYAALLFILVVTAFLHMHWYGWQYLYLTYTANLAMWHHPTLNLGYFDIDHLWSLQVEEQFYLIWPLVVFLVRSPAKIVKISLWTCAAMFAIRVYITAMSGHPGFENMYLPYRPTYVCADNLLFGGCLCALLRTNWRERTLRVAPWVLLGGLTVLLVLGVRHGTLEWVGDTLIPTIGFSLFGISSAALIAMCLVPGSRTQELFQNGTLRFFGKYSYGIYVYHYTLVRLAFPVRMYLGHFMPKAAALGIMAVVIGAVSTLMAMVSYRFFEVKFLHLKARFPYSRSEADREILAKAS